MQHIFLIFLFFTNILATALPAQPRADLMREIAEIIDHEDVDNAFWGIHIKDLNQGTTLFQRNPRKSFMPASNTKLYTTATALELLGPDYQYQTDLYYDGVIEDGVLYGSLIVRGSGDPTFGGRFHDDDPAAIFRQWADALYDLGIERIEGDIIGDNRIFDDVPYGRGWAWDNLSFGYSPQLSGLSFNENVIDITVNGTRDGQPAEIMYEPHNTSYVDIINNTLTIHTDSSGKDRYHRFEGTNEINVFSLVPGGDTVETTLSIHNPTLFFTHVFKETLIREGIPVIGGIRDMARVPIQPDYDRAEPVITYHSVPLAEIVSVTNKDSQNLYAEQMLKTIGLLYTGDEAEPGSHQAGLKVQMDFLAEAGLDTSRVRLADGSGLSRRNLITPELTTDLLTWMWHHPDDAIREAFLESLPVAGIDGTLETRFRFGPSYNNARAKTGYVAHVRTLSGYVTGAGGTPIAFSIMSNHYTLPTRRINRMHERIINVLAEWSEER